MVSKTIEIDGDTVRVESVADGYVCSKVAPAETFERELRDNDAVTEVYNDSEEVSFSFKPDDEGFGEPNSIYFPEEATVVRMEVNRAFDADEAGEAVFVEVSFDE